MPSPFPGMDPYLQAHWRDVHHRLITYACDAMQPHLPPGLNARIEERVYFEDDRGSGRSVYPDVRVMAGPRPLLRPAEGGGDTATLAVDEPVVLTLPSEEIAEGYIRIVDAATGGRVVTVLEFVSPANKTPGPGREAYLDKQREARQAGANLVEVDLIRGGPWVLAFPEPAVPPEYRETTYHVGTFRAARPADYELYPVSLRERLPNVRVPLRPGDSDVVLPLQDLLAQAYRNGAYEDLDYTRDPSPPLAGEDAAWADELLRAAGRRRAAAA